MLIKDILKNQKNFSSNEKIIANFVLKNQETLDKYSTRSLAKATYTSPAAVVRLCQKLGFKGFTDFKRQLINEDTYLSEDFQKLDANFPFKQNDTVREVVGEMTDLYLQTIRDTEKILKMPSLLRCRKLCSNSKEIYIYSFGTYLNQAFSFKEKMMKIGKKVIIPANLDYQLYEAELMEPTDLAIIISYSGETKKSLAIAKMCERKHIPLIGITSVGANSLTKLSKEVLNISTSESLYTNIGDYSIHLSVSYLLDLLYSITFQQNFEQFYQRKVDLAHQLEKDRNTDNSLIN